MDEYGDVCDVHCGGGGGLGLVIDREEREVRDVDCAFRGSMEGRRSRMVGVVNGDLIYKSRGGELLQR